MNSPSQHESEASNIEQSARAPDLAVHQPEPPVNVIEPALQRKVSQVPEVDERFEDSAQNISRISLPNR